MKDKRSGTQVLIDAQRLLEDRPNLSGAWDDAFLGNKAALSYLRQLTAPLPDPRIEEQRAERQAEYDAFTALMARRG